MTSAPWGTPKAFGLSMIRWIARTRTPPLVVPEHGGAPPPSQVCSLRVTEPIPGTKIVVLGKARASERWHPPRPWRSKEETLMITRLALWWHTCRDLSKPSGRSWARQFGISHVWLLKVVRELKEDPDEVRRLQAYRDATVEQLDRAKEYTQRMREHGELRLRSSGRRVSPAMEQFVRERFAQGWSRSRLARELLLDRKVVKRILNRRATTGL